MKFIKKFCLILISLLILISCSSEDSSSEGSGDSNFGKSSKNGTLRIVSGSENKELEDLFEEFSKKEGIKVEVDYLGSLDIMRSLTDENIDYDAVFPASSIWLNMGDENHILKHEKSISQTPIIFGIKKSKAEELGFVGKDVSVKDIIGAIEDERLSFAMTNASQSNSGSSAYLGFLTALSGDEVLSKESLDDEGLKRDIKSLLMGVNRSSGSSNWLVDLFLSSDYDGLVNYETLLIKANKELEDKGEEKLYFVYPYDGIALADSPLAYVDRGDEKAEENFLKFQDFLLSEESQDFIEKTGRRNAFGEVSSKNMDVFDKDLGARLDKDLAYIKYPQKDVIEKALQLYQTSFKKPSYTYYVLDYSGSMLGEGHESMTRALEEIFVPEKAKNHLLQASEDDYTTVLPFSTDNMEKKSASGKDSEMKALYDYVKDIRPKGGTNLFSAVSTALSDMKEEDLSSFSPAIIILSDGMSGDFNRADEIKKIYEDEGLDIPIFSIKFGDADDRDLNTLAEISRGKVFDGKDDLEKTFREVKAYNWYYD